MPKAKKPLLFHRRCWLNGESSASTGSAVGYCGPSPFIGDDAFYTFLEVADCHGKIRLHKASTEDKKDFVAKLRSLSKLASDFAYWISGREIFLNMGMTIYKSSAEGKVLTDMIEAKATVSQVYEWLDSLILTHADPIKLKVKIKQALRDAYAKGKRDKVREIRVALDLEARLTTVLPQGDFHGKEF